jgi:hypothetical protein
VRRPSLRAGIRGCYRPKANNGVHIDATPFPAQGGRRAVGRQVSFAVSCFFLCSDIQNSRKNNGIATNEHHHAKWK